MMLDALDKETKLLELHQLELCKSKEASLKHRFSTSVVHSDPVLEGMRAERKKTK